MSLIHLLSRIHEEPGMVVCVYKPGVPAARQREAGEHLEASYSRLARDKVVRQRDHVASKVDGEA